MVKTLVQPSNALTRAKPILMTSPEKHSSATLTFLKAWLRSPLKVGAIAPSGPRLARAVVRLVPRRSTLPVVELGAGTGAVTQALADRLPPERLVIVERDPELCRLLRRRYPQLTVVQGDARQLRRHLLALNVERVAAVVSGLPLVAIPKRVQREILDQSFAVLEPGGPFIQFTYSLFSPLPRREFGLSGRPVARVLQNVPPASIWVYRRPRHASDRNAERLKQAG